MLPLSSGEFKRLLRHWGEFGVICSTAVSVRISRVETAIAVARREGLVARARRGDQRAWRQLFERDRERVYRVAYRVLLDREEALDTVQETFLKAFENLDRLSDDTGWFAWLRTIAVNGAMDRARQGGRLLRWLGRRVAEEELHCISDRRGGARSLAEASELGQALEVALKRLSPKQRAVASLYFEEGLSGPEIASALGLRPGTVKIQLFRARKRIQKHLAPFRPAEELS